MRFFDTHIHLTDFKDDQIKSLAEMFENLNVERCVCATSQPQEWEKASRLAKDFQNKILPSFGVHPWFVQDDVDLWQEKLALFLEKFDNAAVGECGLDLLKGKDISLQKKVFEVHFKLAKRYKRALIIHSLKADSVMQNYDHLLPQKSVFHSFSGSFERAKQLIKYGFYISVNLNFFKKKDAAKILKNIPSDRLLIETDAPYQTEVSDLKKVVQNIAQIRNESAEEISETLYANAQEVFYG